jgi:hypothetical protein
MNNKDFVRIDLVIIMAIISALLLVGCAIVKDNRLFGGVLPDCQYPIGEWSPVRSTACGPIK